MYTTICTYTLVPGSRAKLEQRLQAEYESLIRYLPGLVNYYLIEGKADQLISISIFDSKGHTDLCSGPLGYCMRKVLGDCLLGQPQIVSGQTAGEEQRRNVLNHAGVSASGNPQQGAMKRSFVRPLEVRGRVSKPIGSKHDVCCRLQNRPSLLKKS